MQYTIERRVQGTLVEQRKIENGSIRVRKADAVKAAREYCGKLSGTKARDSIIRLLGWSSADGNVPVAAFKKNHRGRVVRV